MLELFESIEIVIAGRYDDDFFFVNSYFLYRPFIFMSEWFGSDQTGAIKFALLRPFGTDISSCLMPKCPQDCRHTDHVLEFEIFQLLA